MVKERVIFLILKSSDELTPEGKVKVIRFFSLAELCTVNRWAVYP